MPRAKVQRINEGDTSVTTKRGQKVRIGGLNAPDLHRRSAEERQERRERVKEQLLGFGGTLTEGATFTGDAEADEFLRSDPFAFLVAASLDRGARAESVWKIPWLLAQRLGRLDPNRLGETASSDLEGILRALPRKPRFPNQAARTIISLARLVSDELNGDADKAWVGKPVASVLGFLQRVYGVGPGIAAMTVRILIDEGLYKPQHAELAQIDIKPDVHTTRVFYRCGLASSRDERDCKYAARTLHPEFPAKLDWPAWEIGRSYCHETNPLCATCPLDNVCPKQGFGA